MRRRAFAAASLLVAGCGEVETAPLLAVDASRPDADAPQPDARPTPADAGASFDAGPRPEFPDGCLPVDGYLFCLIARTFDDARATCVAAGGDIVILETDAENRRVSDAFTEWNGRPFWLGLTDEVTEDSWFWIDGRPLGTFDAWNVGEPNDLEGEDCAHGNWTGPRIWNDIDCFDRYPSVCEFPPGSDIRCVVDADCRLSFGRCVAGSCRAG